MQALDLVGLGRAVALALSREHVEHDRAGQAGGLLEGAFEGGDVVAVDRAQVADAEGLEEHVRLDELTEGRDDAVDGGVGDRAHPGQVAQRPRSRSRTWRYEGFSLSWVRDSESLETVGA